MAKQGTVEESINISSISSLVVLIGYKMLFLLHLKIRLSQLQVPELPEELS